MDSKYPQFTQEGDVSQNAVIFSKPQAQTDVPAGVSLPAPAGQPPVFVDDSGPDPVFAGGSDAGAGQGEAHTLSVNVTAGPLVANPGGDLVVDAYDSHGLKVASATVLSNGSYYLSVPKTYKADDASIGVKKGDPITGVLLRVHDKNTLNSQVPTYMDEATQSAKSYGDLLAVVDMSDPQKPSTVNISPLTQVAALKAGINTAKYAAPADVSAIQQANQSVGLLFLGNADLLGTAPAPTVSKTGSLSSNPDTYGVVLHAISQLESSGNKSTQEVTQSLAQGITSTSDERSLNSTAQNTLTSALDTVKVAIPALASVGDAAKDYFATSVNTGELIASAASGAPTVSSVALTGATNMQNHTLNAGDVLSATVSFNQAVTVTGSPRLTLSVGNTRVLARYASGSGSDALVFKYTILGEQTDTNGISIPANALRLNGGSIKAGEAKASLSHAAVGNNADYMVDTSAPDPLEPLLAIDSTYDQPDFLRNDRITNDPSLNLSGAQEPGASIEYRTQKGEDDFSAWSSSYNIAPTPDHSTDGNYTVEVRQKDAAGNTSAVRSLNFTLDTRAPDVAIHELVATSDSTKSRGFTVTTGATVLVYANGSDTPLSDEDIQAKFTVDIEGQTGLDVYLAKAGAFDGNQAYRVSASLRSTADNEGTATLILQPLYAPVVAVNPLQLYASHNDNARVKNTYDQGFYVTEDAVVKISMGGVPLSEAEVNAKFDISTSAGLKAYIAKSGQFTGNEANLTVDATLTRSGKSYSVPQLSLLPIDTIAPDAATLTLGSGVSGGATASEATSASGVVNVTAEAGATVEVGFSQNAGGYIARSVKGNGLRPVPVTLSAADLGSLRDGTVLVNVKVTDDAGNSVYKGATSNPSFVLDRVAPTFGTVGPKFNATTLAGTPGDSVGESLVLTLSFSSNVYGLTTSSTADSSIFKVNGVGVQAVWGGVNGSKTRTLSYTIASGQNGQASIDETALKGALLSGLTDLAGNAFALTGDIANIDSTPLRLIDSAAPTATLTTGTGLKTENATVASSEVGTAYLVKTGGAGPVTVTSVASITGAPESKWNSVAIDQAGSNTVLGLAGLEDGTYSLYTVDAAGNLSSPATGRYTVTSGNRAPTGEVSIAGLPTQGQVLTASNTLADADGLGIIAYQWQSSADGSSWTDITGATAASLPLTQAQVGKKLHVLASYTDRNNTAESVASSATETVANLNDAPTGSVSIGGTATQGQTLSASNTLADVDGLGVLGYQWKSSTDGSSWTDIAGATASTLVLDGAQVGKRVKVAVSYTDGGGTSESVDSGATDAVVGSNQTLSGSVVAGPLLANPGADLVVDAYDAQGHLLGSAAVDADGRYTLTIARQNTVLLRVHDKDQNDADVPTYMDEVTHTSKAFTELLAVVDAADQTALAVNITPLTQVAALKAGINPAQSYAAPANVQTVQQANQSVGLLFLSDADLLGSAPQSTVNKQGQFQSGADPYGLVLHLISQLESSGNKSTQEVTQSLAQGIASTNDERSLSGTAQSTLSSALDTVKGVNPSLATVGDTAKDYFATSINTSELSASSAASGAPTVSSVALTGATNMLDHTLNAGDVLSARVSFNQTVTVTGSPRLTLNIGGTRVLAKYASGSGSDALVFNYTILGEQTDTNGISVPANALRLNGGEIKAGAVNARLSHAAVADNADYRVDTSAPDPLEPSLANDSTYGQPTYLRDDRITNDPSLSLSGIREAGASVEYRSQKGNAAFSAWSSSYNIAPTPDHSTDGEYTVEVRQKDAAGNTSAVRSFNFTLDTTPPALLLAEKVNENDSTKSRGFTVTPGAAVLVYVDGSQTPLSSADMTAKFTFFPLGDNGQDVYLAKEGAFGASGQSFTVSASLRDEVNNEATASLTGQRPLYWVEPVASLLSLFRSSASKALLRNTYDEGFYVTQGAQVTVKVGGVALTAEELASKFTTSTSQGYTGYTAKSGQFTGSEQVTVDATLTVNQQTYTATRLSLLPIDTTAPGVPTVVLATGVSGGATASEATSSSGVVTVSAEQGAQVTVGFTGAYNYRSKTVTGNGSTPVPVTLTATDLKALGDGTVKVDVTVKDVAGNSTYKASASNPSFVLDTLAPTFGTVAPKVNATTLAGTPGDSVGESLVLTLSFSSNVYGLTASSSADNGIFKVGDSGVPALWGGVNGSKTRTLTYTIADGQNGQASIDEVALKTALVNGLTDQAGNAFAYTGAIANIDSTPLPEVGVSTVAPVFNSGATGSVTENAPISTVIYTASTQNGQGVVYSLQDGGDKAFLAINPSSGVVTLLASADYETKNSYSFTVVATKGSLSSAQPVTVSVGNVDETFDIQLEYDSSVPDAVKHYFSEAAARWSSVIVEDLSNVGEVDDLLLSVKCENIDGVGLELAHANADALRQGGARLPYQGSMTFDLADAPTDEASGQIFFSTVLHEMGHTLGLDADLFSAAGLLDAGNPLHYTGAQALAAYRVLKGDNSLSYVPLEDTGGPLTRGQHWSEEVFGNELMTGYNRGASTTPLSRLTLGALADLGYTVNANAADAYALPSTQGLSFSGASATAQVTENVASTTSVYQAQATGSATLEGYGLSGEDAAVFRVNGQGQVFFRVSPDHENPLDAGGDNSYHFNLIAQGAGNVRVVQAVTLTVGDDAPPASAGSAAGGAMALWQGADAAAAQSIAVQALNQYSQEIVQQRESTSRDGSANQSASSQRQAQWVDRVTGTDIVSTEELSNGVVITGHTLPGMSASIRFRLDNDRSDGVNGADALEFTPGRDAAYGVNVVYNNETGDWRMELDPGANALSRATHNVRGSGIHQLVVDTNGNALQDAGEASRLFLVADGTAGSTDTGTVAQNYSVQDKITGEVFVYYFGDPDGAGVGMKTLLDSGDTTGSEVTTDRDHDGSDADYYNIDVSTTPPPALPPVTAGNTALHLVTDIPVQTWEFHMGQGQGTLPFAGAQSMAADHNLLGSNTSRLASLQELVALYAANFGGGGDTHTVGAVRALGNANSKAGENHLPGGWTAADAWSAAPTPSGHASLDFTQGLIVDQLNIASKAVVAVL